MRVTHVFEADPAEVGGARRFAHAALNRCGLDDDDIPLLVSELATNAVLHARSEFAVTLWVRPGRVRVEVSDGNTRLPLLQRVPADAQSGRGLFLVKILSEVWGVDSTYDDGKTVWFEVPVNGPLVGSCQTVGESK